MADALQKIRRNSNKNSFGKKSEKIQETAKWQKIFEKSEEVKTKWCGRKAEN